MLKLKHITCAVLAAAVLFTTGLTACKNGDVIPMGDGGVGGGSMVTGADGSPVDVATDSDGSVITTDTEPITITDAEGNVITIPTAAPESSDTTVETDKDGNTLPPKKDLPLKKKLGFIYRGNIAGNPSNEIFEDSRLKAHSDLGVETAYVSQVLVQQFGDAVTALKEQGYNVIVAADPSFANSAAKSAKENPDLDFIVFGGDTSAANLASVQPLFYQAANVAGLAAAYASKSGKVGIVADPTMYNYHGVADAFTLGVRMVDKDFTNVRLNLAFGENHQDTKAAVNDLLSGGCDVVFVYQNDDYGIKYCESLNVTVAAYSAELPLLAPKNYLTGFYFNVSGWLNENVRYMQNDEFHGKSGTGTIKDKFVGLFKLNPTLTFGGNGNATITADELQTTVLDLLIVNIIEKDRVFIGEARDTAKTIRIVKGDALGYVDVLKVDWLIDGIVLVKNFSSPKGDADVIYGDLAVHGTAANEESGGAVYGGDSEPQ